MERLCIGTPGVHVSMMREEIFARMLLRLKIKETLIQLNLIITQIQNHDGYGYDYMK